MRSLRRPILTGTLLGILSVAGLGAAPLDTPPDPDPARFNEEIAAFPAAGSPEIPRQPIVFVGSSSFRMWKTLESDFPDLPVVNRGFGGSHLSDLNAWLERLVVPLAPSVVLVYEGDNDLAAGKSIDRFLADLESFRERVRKHLPGVPVGFLAIKPSPSRERLLPQQEEANRRLRDWCGKDSQFTYLDVAQPLLDAAGRPDPLYFGRDRLHMNDNGYHLWRRVIGPWLEQLPRSAGKPVSPSPGDSRP